MESYNEFEILITVTGFNNYPNAKRLLDGDKIMLLREYENEYDKSAIAVYSEFGKIGYVANSEKTVRKGTMSAGYLAEIMENTATAKVVEGGYYEAICRVTDLLDIDKIILKACQLYNECCYDEALELFLIICEKYKSVMLMQYTADCFIKTGQYKESLNFSKQAMELEDNNKTSIMMYATALHKLDRYDEAIIYYSKLLKLTYNKNVKDAYEECIALNRKKNENQ